MACLLVPNPDGPARVLPLAEEWPNSVGRHPENIIVFDNPSVSAHHAALDLGSEGWTIADHHSSNGTQLNKIPLKEKPVHLHDEDVIRFGEVEVQFFLTSPPPALLTPPVKKPETPANESSRSSAQKRTPQTPPPDPWPVSIATVIIFAVALTIGMAARHHQETGRNLFADLSRALMDSMPRIIIQKPARNTFAP